MKQNDSMKPVDVGAGRLIPAGNLNPSQPGSYGNMRAALDAAYAASDKFLSRGSAYPGFKPCYTAKGLEGDWQCMTNTSKKK